MASVPLPRIPRSVQLGSSEDRVKGIIKAHLSLPIPSSSLLWQVQGTEGASLVFLLGGEGCARETALSARWLSAPAPTNTRPYTHT